jgi:hypothetical protein
MSQLAGSNLTFLSLNQIFRKPYVLTGFDNDVQLAVMDEGKKQGIK